MPFEKSETAKKSLCQYCGAMVTGESDLFECPECGWWVCKNHMVVVVENGQQNVRCAFCAAEKM